MPYVNYETLRKNISVEQVACMLDLELKQSGEQLRGHCPACDSDNPRALVVTPTKGVFYCHKAKTGGGIIELVSHIRELPQNDAAKAIEYHFNPKAKQREAKKEQPKANGSKLTEIAKRLDAEAEELEALGISPETYEAFGAGYNRRGTLSGKLLIPIHDKDGELIAYCGRDVEKGTLHFHSFDPSTTIFNAHRIQEAELIVCRDPLTVLRAHEHSEMNVVAFMADITPELLEMLAELMREKKCPCVSLF